MEQQRFHAIVTHHRPHPDELVAWRMLTHWFPEIAEQHFPGISARTLSFGDQGPQPPDGISVEELERSGVLALGIWGSWTDEHPANGEERKRQDCCATLVARRLGVTDHPGVGQILKWVYNHDVHGNGGPMDMSAMLNVKYDEHPDDPWVAITWFFQGLDPKFRQDSRFWVETRALFGQCARRVVIGLEADPYLLLVVIEDADTSLSRYARAQAGGDCDVVIQRNPVTGHVAIVTRTLRNQPVCSLKDLARMLRQEELRLAGDVRERPFAELEQDGTHPDVPAWHYQEPAQRILNGGRVSPGAVATKIPLDRIVELAQIALDPTCFPYPFDRRCTANECTSSPRTPCPFYDFGLFRCREIRSRKFRPADLERRDLTQLFGGSARVNEHPARSGIKRRSAS
ncbi:MAG: hypothetical protein Q7T01_02550 [bacterium]|nr:hypothetical protein [bacterium]